MYIGYDDNLKHFYIENDYRIIKDNLSFNEIKNYMKNGDKYIFTGYTDILPYIDNKKQFDQYIDFTESPFYYENSDNPKK